MDTYEVGIMLKGTEVKSVRTGKLELAEAFVIVRKSELWLVNAYIHEYSQGNIYNHLPRREGTDHHPAQGLLQGQRPESGNRGL
jgi:SsrA-binding protein